MAHNRDELKEKISKLPIFEKRDVYVNNSTDEDNVTKTKQIQQAICEVNGTEALAYVYKNYKLVQFATIFDPILDSIEGPVSGYLGDYKGFAFLKIFPEDPMLKDNRAQFGLMAVNSVDLSASIMVKFVVKHNNDFNFTIPAKIAGLKKQHTGKVENVVKDYVSMIGKVKSAWYTIVDSFPKYTICIDADKAPEGESVLEFGTVIDKLNIGTRLSKKIKKEYEERLANGKTYTLWDLFIKVVDETAQISYKSDAHRERRLDTLSNAVFQYAMLLNI